MQLLFFGLVTQTSKDSYEIITFIYCVLASTGTYISAIGIVLVCTLFFLSFAAFFLFSPTKIILL